MAGRDDKVRLFTSGFSDKILVYNVDSIAGPVPNVTLDQDIMVQDGYTMSYAYYSKKHSSLYTVHEPQADAENNNGTVARWEVDLRGKPTFTRKEVVVTYLLRTSFP